MTRKELAVLVLMFTVTGLPSEGALPDYNCSAQMDKMTPPTDGFCEKTGAAAELIRQCIPFLNAIATLPSMECCAGVHDVWSKWPACFCFLTFFPPMVPRGGDLSTHHAMPLFCNLTADLCSVCPNLLFPPGGKISHKKMVAFVSAFSVCAVVAVALCISAIHWRKKLFAGHYEHKFAHDRIDMMKIGGKPTIYTHSMLKAATKNFDPGSKLGEGGFGSVFKGVLPDSTEVAVKQLSAKSQQGTEEFLNEVTLITSVQHRNLVKLRGCCLKGEERLLVYEFLENKSLHQALFDAERPVYLNWPTRMKILQGTARGLAYFHEGCHIRIVHRDIKASNILLDKDLNPKIADFGLARIFSENDTHVSTRVAGTAGYLAPEYAMRGQLTEKADVFSFGIVALELVSGRPNLNIDLEPHVAYLLDWTWQLYEENFLTDLLDPTIAWTKTSIDNALRVVELALVCTHSRATMRPTMSNVVSILTESGIEMPKPTKTAVRDYADLNLKFLGLSSNTTSSSLQSSTKIECELSNRSSSIISNLEPR